MRRASWIPAVALVASTGVLVVMAAYWGRHPTVERSRAPARSFVPDSGSLEPASAEQEEDGEEPPSTWGTNHGLASGRMQVDGVTVVYWSAGESKSELGFFASDPAWGAQRADGVAVVLRTAEEPVAPLEAGSQENDGADAPDTHELEAPRSDVDAWLMGGGADRAGLATLDLGDGDLTDAGLAYLRAPSSLSKVSVRYTAVTDAGIADLCRIASVQELNIGGTRLTNQGLAALEGLTNLRKLYVWRTGVSDAGLAHIGRVWTLEHLYIGDVTVSGWGLRYLRCLHDLNTLWLENSQLDDAGAAELGALASLEDVNLAGTRLTDTGVPHLLRLPRLRRICISNTAVTDDGVALLRQAFPSVEVIRQ